MAVMDGDSGQKKRITKRMACQRLISALRMTDMENIDIPYLAPLSNRIAYEKYMDKTAARVDDEGYSWKDGGITSVNYLRKVVEEVGTDLYRIYRQIHKDTNLPLQKIVSQRAGIVAYLDMQKTVKTGSIRKRIINQNATGVSMIIDNILQNTELANNPSKRTEFLTTLLFMSTVDRHADDGIRAPLLWSTEEGTGKTSTLKVIPEAIKKTMVTDAAGVGANDFQVQQNVFVLEDVTMKDITEDKRGVVWALATGGSTSVKVHSTSKTILPKWVIGTSNENIPDVCDQMTRGSRKEQAVIRGMQSRFMLVQYNKKYRGELEEQNILLDNDARMDLFVSVMTEIAANPGYYRRQYETNVFKALYMVEAARLLESYPEHQLFKSRNYRTVIEGLHNYVETHQTEMIIAENQDRQDYDLMMGNISEGLGLRTKAEEERIGQELETVMRDIAAMEGIDLDELLATPMPEEEALAEEMQNNLNDTWLNTFAHQALMNATILPPNMRKNHSHRRAQAPGRKTKIVNVYVSTYMMTSVTSRRWTRQTGAGQETTIARMKS